VEDPSSLKTPDPLPRPTDQPSAIQSQLPTRPMHPGGVPQALDRTHNADLSFLAPPKRPEALGRLDHYDILEVRGRGGFGIVFKAFDDKLHRVVALKVLSPHLAASPVARKRFLREAQAAAAVHDDHVVAIFAVEDGTCPYIVMEYVDGPSLQEKLRGSGAFPIDEILRIGYQAACGLAAAHQQGLIHRDIKPDNILLQNGVARVKITDFGLARAVDDASISLPGEIFGTPAYMAPEQAAGEIVDLRADLFSLGSVLYTLATGRPPFESSTSIATLRSILDEPPTPLRQVRPELPPWFTDVVDRLHAKLPARRYQTAQEVADALAPHLTTLQAPTQTHPVGPRRWRVVPWVIAALGSAAIAFAIWHFWHPASPSTASPVLTPPPPAAAPFDAAQARLHQTAWADYLRMPVEQTNSVGMTLRLVPPGDFVVEGQDAHLVRISKPFYLGAHEVTVAQFRAFADATGYKTYAERDPLGGKVWNPQQRRTDQRPDVNWRSPGYPQTEQHPVACVTWHDATAFCRWLSERDGKTYRLPTEAEWEYACRAGTTTAFNYGPMPDKEKMNAAIRGTTPVGSFRPNAFGMYDMHGNVYEWCLDGRRTYAAGVAIDPRGPDDPSDRVIRGGAYSSGGPVLRSDGRSTAQVDHAYSGNGLRVLLECR
jgi:serine/threonine protein kinase